MYAHLTLEEKYQIKALLERGLSCRAIADILSDGKGVKAGLPSAVDVTTSIAHSMEEDTPDVTIITYHATSQAGLRSLTELLRRMGIEAEGFRASVPGGDEREASRYGMSFNVAEPDVMEKIERALVEAVRQKTAEAERVR